MERITANGFKVPRTLMRTIKRHVRKWIDREASVLFLPKNAEYSVHLEQQGAHRTRCQVQILIGSRKFQGTSEGHSAQDAVIDALAHAHIAAA